jgi:hypothetical protein
MPRRARVCPLEHCNNAGAGHGGSHLEAEFLQMFCDKVCRTVFLFTELRILVNVAPPRDQFALDLSGSLPDLLLKIRHPRLRVQRP